jgi:hypothetical protein
MGEGRGCDVFDKVRCVNSRSHLCDGVVLQRCIARNDRLEPGSGKTVKLDFLAVVRGTQGRSNAIEMQNDGFAVAMCLSLRASHLNLTWPRRSWLARLLRCRPSSQAFEAPDVKTYRKNQTGVDSDCSSDMVMKTWRLSCAYVLIVLFLTALSVKGSDLQGDNGARIDRSSTLESGELDQNGQQQIAQILGNGEFAVRTARIRSQDKSLEAARVFFVFATKDALRNHEPVKRIFCSGNNTEARIASGDDGELVRYFLEQLAAKTLDPATVGEIMPGILCAAVYANQAELWHADSGKLSDAGLENAGASDHAKRTELQTLGRDPQVSHDSEGSLVWEGCFLLGDGGFDEVTVTLPSCRDRAVRVKRLEVRPWNYFKNGASEIVDTETWIVSNESTWHPSKRDSFTYTLAALGNTKAKYQLGLALMDEFDETAKAEGLKWLRAAAADGYGEAIARLALIEADPRAPRDRESVRKVNCCRPAPRQ